jgi:hypothetical protein
MCARGHDEDKAQQERSKRSGMAQAVSQDLRRLKSVVVVLGVILVVGFAALLATIALRLAHFGRASTETPVTLSLPREAEIGHVALDGKRLVLHVQRAGAEEILVVDLESGAVERRVALVRE